MAVLLIYVRPVLANARQEKFVEMGIKSMPVVVITKGKNIEDIWCDYQIDKIKEWNKAQQNSN